MSGGKGEIEDKLDKFVDKSYDRFSLTHDQCMSKENAKILMKELMIKHGNGNAWDDEEFNKIFNLFEEDEPSEADGSASKAANQGLDRSEFTKLVKRVAQL